MVWGNPRPPRCVPLQLRPGKGGLQRRTPVHPEPGGSCVLAHPVRAGFRGETCSLVPSLSNPKRVSSSCGGSLQIPF